MSKECEVCGQKFISNCREHFCILDKYVTACLQIRGEHGATPREAFEIILRNLVNEIKHNEN